MDSMATTAEEGPMSPQTKELLRSIERHAVADAIQLAAEAMAKGLLDFINQQRTQQNPPDQAVTRH